ncbi:MAG: tyrosine--tRNA ligase [Candidatus Omnitrophica bacterium]|nr:tyrosine--tRNA ligase [Candidatus Omnitrophota bacterium]
MSDKRIKEQLDLIRRGTVEIISETELAKKIERSLQTEKPLVIKAGFDPSAPDLHLGHTVLLRKMLHFQQLGHEVFFIIGDFTGRIGDPTGKTEKRKPLGEEEIQKNTKTYKEQVFKILDPTKTKVVFNGKWLGKLRSEDFMILASRVTFAQLSARADFKERIARKEDVSLNELLYPLLQAYDSVELKADVELGGTDQKFNLLMGRDLQKDFHQEPQAIVLMPLLEGLDGVQKMSKSLGNSIGIQEEPKEMFGKIMSISDDLMLRYYELLTNVDVEKVKSEIKSGKNPKLIKEELAFSITKDFHGEAKANVAKAEFQKVFQQKGAPADIPVFTIQPNADGKVDILKFLLDTGLVSSMAEARRLLQQGSIKLNHSSKIQERFFILNEGDILQAGPRKFIKIKR